MPTKLPAFRNPKLADARRPGAGAAARERPFDDGQEFPVVVFNHGLGRSRTSYSTVCEDLASYGFVLVAMEPRDGSGARSSVDVPEGRNSPELNQDERGSASALGFERAKDEATT